MRPPSTTESRALAALDRVPPVAAIHAETPVTIRDSSVVVVQPVREVLEATLVEPTSERAPGATLTTGEFLALRAATRRHRRYPGAPSAYAAVR